MPETSVAMRVTENLTATLVGIRNQMTPFRRDLGDLDRELNALSSKRTTIKVDMAQAKQELTAAKKAFSELSDEQNRSRLEVAQGNYDKLADQLNAVSRAARQTQKDMQDAATSISAADNRAARAGGGEASGLAQLGKSGLINLVGSGLSELGGTLLSSALGSGEAGTMASSLLSGLASGAAMGSLAGPFGTAVGAAVGALGGALSGAAKNFAAQDDAFKSYVQDAVESQLSQRTSDIVSGSSIAAGRESDLVSFSTLFGDRATAQKYLSDLVTMANTTPFLYGDLTSMSKTLATYGYGDSDILPVLRNIGDTGAALGMDTSGMTMVATALGRMKSSDKTSLEYLNILNDRGIGAVGMLADYYEVDQGKIYDAISKGKLSGQKTVEIILQAMEEKYAGAMERQSETFSGKSSTLEGLNQEVQNAYGQGYNAERLKGMQAEIDWLSGMSGEAQKEANEAVGKWQASLENAKERYTREAVDAAMGSQEYLEAKASGDGATMGRLIAQARIKGTNDYYANEGKDEELANQIALIEAVRNDESIKDAYRTAGYDLGQELSKGMASAVWQNEEVRDALTRSIRKHNGTDGARGGGFGGGRGGSFSGSNGNAAGLGRVPYDGYVAMLHQGERVLTAAEARAADRGGNVPINITLAGTYYVRDEADVEQIAEELADRLAVKLRGGWT